MEKQNFEDTVSFKDVISLQTSKLEGFFINFRTLPLLVVKQVESKFCRLFCTFGAEFQISFLVSLLLDSTKRVLFLPCKVIKMKSEILDIIFSAGFVSFRWK